MLKQEDSGGLGVGVTHKNNWARVCDTCRGAACTVYCRADSAYLCSACDARIHAANKLSSRHERVWVCEACERAPAAFLCKADAASLCATCDSDIHSANSLARRHRRVPILSIPSTLNYGPPATGDLNLHIDDDDDFLTHEDDQGEEIIDEDDENEAASWLLFNNPVKKGNINNNNQGGGGGNNIGMMFGSGEGVDEYLDLVEYGSGSCPNYQFNHDHYNNNYTTKYEPDQQQQHYVVPQKTFAGGSGDSVVPTARGARDGKNHHQSFQLGLDYEASNAGYGYHPASLSHNVSVSSMDVGVVPDCMVSDVSISANARPSKGTIDLFSSAPLQAPQQPLTPMDREARVLRYREKKKTRKFEKTIRYASRKAYAETRPRIKGRFAKRTQVDVQVLSTTLITDNGYSIVPSF